MKHLTEFKAKTIGGTKSTAIRRSHHRAGQVLAVISAFVIPLSWAVAQNTPSTMSAAPKAVPAGQAGLLNPNGINGGTTSGMTTAPTTNPGMNPNVPPPGFVPPVNSVNPMPNPQINFPGEVNPPQNQPGSNPGSGLGGSNNSVNTSPFAPSMEGNGSLGSTPQIGTGRPGLNTTSPAPAM